MVFQYMNLQDIDMMPEWALHSTLENFVTMTQSKIRRCRL
jgi:hypothetical protein